MPNFERLRACLLRIEEIAQEDSSSVVSLGVVPAVQLALRELNNQYAYTTEWIHLSKLSIKASNIAFVNWDYKEGGNTFARVYFVGLPNNSCKISADSPDFKLLSESLFIHTMNPSNHE